MHGLRNIRSAITREMLLFKAEISYNIQLNIENNWLWQPSIINIFKVSFVIRAYHIYAINSEIFCSQRRRKKNECLFRNNVLNKILHYITEFTSYYSRKKPLASLTSLATTLNNFGARLETISAL